MTATATRAASSPPVDEKPPHLGLLFASLMVVMLLASLGQTIPVSYTHLTLPTKA